MTATRAKKQGYRFGVQWIADNDEPDVLDADVVSGFVSTLLLADLFGKDADQVARDIVRARERGDA